MTQILREEGDIIIEGALYNFISLKSLLELRKLDVVFSEVAIRFEACSDRFLDEIRYLSFTSVFISDIGYTKDRQLKCTAMRGRLPELVTMSIPDAVTRYGQRTWTSFSGIVDPRITADMMESKNVLLFPAPAPADFSSFLQSSSACDTAARCDENLCLKSPPAQSRTADPYPYEN